MTDPTPAEPARRHTVDTLTDPELTRLYSELEAAKYDAEMRQHREVRHRARAERAEAALERVRKALHAISIDIGRHRGTSDPEMLAYRLGLIDADRQLRAALDEQQEQQT
ncbi:hypothetical protein [Streptomyces sp. NPDC013457]|uniref:hypothetical protein n=1 Tax=Streptomyces sp. NPDC013457 TaxID=3364866 RepID=UPI0036FC40CE